LPVSRLTQASRRSPCTKTWPSTTSDLDGDGRAEPPDAIRILRHLFQGGPIITCEDAADAADADDADDADDDGVVAINDAIYILTYLFLGGSEIPGPTGECGVDWTRDAIECEFPIDCGGFDPR